MYLRWKTRRRSNQGRNRWDWRAGCWRSESVLRTAVLVTSSRFDGKPRQRYVATLGSIDAVWLIRPPGAEQRYDRNAVEVRIRFWKGTRRRLARLVAQGTLTAEQCDQLDQQIAETVPLPTDADLAITSDHYRHWWAQTPEEDEAEIHALLGGLDIAL